MCLTATTAWRRCSGWVEYEPPADAAESVHTLVARYSELDALFSEEAQKTDALPYFIDWLKGSRPKRCRSLRTATMTPTPSLRR